MALEVAEEEIVSDHPKTVLEGTASRTTRMLTSTADSVEEDLAEAGETALGPDRTASGATASRTTRTSTSTTHCLESK